MKLATVARIHTITPHPDGDKIEIVKIIKCPAGDGGPLASCTCTSNDSPIRNLVTGKHYRVGDLGVWLRPGGVIPGEIAYELWMVGKKRSAEPFVVIDIPIRGVPSPGLWGGAWYRNDSSKESKLKAEDMRRGGGQVVNGWISWARWNPDWRVGDEVAEELGITEATPEQIQAAYAAMEVKP